LELSPCRPRVQIANDDVGHLVTVLARDAEKCAEAGELASVVVAAVRVEDHYPAIQALLALLDCPELGIRSSPVTCFSILALTTASSRSRTAIPAAQAIPKLCSVLLGNSQGVDDRVFALLHQFPQVRIGILRCGYWGNHAGPAKRVGSWRLDGGLI